MSAPRIVYAKMAASLDRNRKIRRGGRDARDVFLWVLRQCADRDAAGVIPAEDLLDLEFMADTLLCSVEDVERGIEAAVRVGLISIVGDEVFVCGWEDEWGKRPMTGAERQKRYKTKGKTSPGDGGDGAPSPSDAGDGGENEGDAGDGHVSGDASEQASKQGKKDERHPVEATGPLFGSVDPEPEPEQRPKEPTLAERLAVAACAEINRLTGSKFQDDSKSVAKLCKALANAKHTTDEVELVVRAKHAEWHASATMRQRLVPATLLALENFEKYLDEIRARAPAAPGQSAPRRADGWAVPPEAMANLKLTF